MAEKIETGGEAGSEGKGCGHSHCCGGKKTVCGVLIGLLLAGAGFGLYKAGKCAARGGCPYSAQVQK